MEIKDKVIVVTGGASGIGKALCEKFANEGAKAIVVADINEAGIAATITLLAEGCKSLGVKTDVSKENDIQQLVATSLENFGQIDLFCSNAGILTLGGPEVPNEEWQRIWDINVMAHIYASRAVLPHMLERGEGYLLNTASAAGLLNQVDAAPYAVSKHAVIGYAEYLSFTYGDRGIKVSVLCPQAVQTPMVEGAGDAGVAGINGILDPAILAQCVVDTLAKEKFLCLPHPQVSKYIKHKAGDYDKWLMGMRELQKEFGVH